MTAAATPQPEPDTYHDLALSVSASIDDVLNAWDEARTWKMRGRWPSTSLCNHTWQWDT